MLMKSDIYFEASGDIALGSDAKARLVLAGMREPVRSQPLVDVGEPFLIQLGFLDRTRQGRVATRLAYEHMGLKRRDEPPQAQRGLFGD